LPFTTLPTKLSLTGICGILLLLALAVSTCVFISSSQAHVAAAGVGYGIAHGCLSNSVVKNARLATVTVTPQQANSTITAHIGDLIEFQFPFGSRWNGPTTSQGNLALQPPPGYAVRMAQICVWRFMATGPGTTRLNFSKGPLCRFSRPCPYFLSVLLPFTIAVQ
jgi:hypothetical protein